MEMTTDFEAHPHHVPCKKLHIERIKSWMVYVFKGYLCWSGLHWYNSDFQQYLDSGLFTIILLYHNI